MGPVTSKIQALQKPNKTTSPNLHPALPHLIQTIALLHQAGWEEVADDFDCFARTTWSTAECTTARHQRVERSQLSNKRAYITRADKHLRLAGKALKRSETFAGSYSAFLDQVKGYEAQKEEWEAEQRNGKVDGVWPYRRGRENY